MAPLSRLHHCYPVNHRPARLIDRKKYYSNIDFSLIERWFMTKPRELRKPIFHIDPGNETKYCKKEHRENLGKLIYFNIKDFRELREMVLDYLPEDLYYDRNIYKDPEGCTDCEDRGEGCLKCDRILGQELMFDIDPENIECPNCGTLEDRVKGKSMFKFCYICFNMAVDQTLKMHGELENMGCNRLEVVYSGRGFHIYSSDDWAYIVSFQERRELAEKFKKNGFAIDPWVTEGEARLARVPYSLNGMVSRVCMPINIKEIKKLDYWRSKPFVPDFL